jgi:hypothetical protein
MPGVLFAILVMVLALGNSWLGIFPYGSAVWVRPLVGCTGLIGAICLLRGNRWWQILLPLWSICQSIVIATDVSGRWFYQGISLGVFITKSETVRSNNLVILNSERGLGTTGIILLGAIGVIAIFRLHPTVRRNPSRKSVAWVLLALVAFAIVASNGLAKRRDYNAAILLDLNVPNVRIYYKDQLLGRTPLQITPQRITGWGLPLRGSSKLRLYAPGWADCVILSDGTTSLPLYAAPPWPFGSYLDRFQSPWGQRCRMSIDQENESRLYGYLFPAADRRDEPVLVISILNPQPVKPLAPLKVHCVLTNPTSITYEGRLAEIAPICFSYERRSDIRTPPRDVDMPSNWNTLMPGQTLQSDITFHVPATVGDYEWFCTWFLYDKTPNSQTGAGSVYSNILQVKVK